jgi:hypothetical protein
MRMFVSGWSSPDKPLAYVGIRMAFGTSALLYLVAGMMAVQGLPKRAGQVKVWRW